MPGAKEETALEVEVMSWRIWGVCVTMAVEVDVGNGVTLGAGGVGSAGFTEGQQETFILACCY